MMTRILISIPPEQLALTRSEALRQGISTAAVIRWALEVALQGLYGSANLRQYGTEEIVAELRRRQGR